MRPLRTAGLEHTIRLLRSSVSVARSSQQTPSDSMDYNDPLPRRQRRLPQVWPDPSGSISYLLTLCVEGRQAVLANEETYLRLTQFLLASPRMYGWFGRRFVIMPDHLHLMASQGVQGISLGRWVQALKAVVGGLEPRTVDPGSTENGAESGRPLARTQRSWRWQSGYHDHKIRSTESEPSKWVYLCLNPVRAGLVARPEEWPFSGEMSHIGSEEARVIRGSPPLLETGILLQEQRTSGPGPL